ncbi:dipeptidyl-peptidase [Aureococcus anophagefferens]|nr:dipeptidyl-peptidase [Aureococcus anophagefferens]
MTTARSVLENPALTDARVPDRVWASELFDSLKKNDHQRTLSTYAEARSARARLNVHCYNGILHVLADRGLNGECEEVVADMRRNRRRQRGEATALARSHVAAGALDDALAVVATRLEDASPKLRTYAPLVAALCAADRVRAARTVWAAMAAGGVAPTDDLYVALLEALARSGDAAGCAACLRERAAADDAGLSAPHLKRVSAALRSLPGATCEATTVDDDGACRVSGRTLPTGGLDARERAQFAAVARRQRDAGARPPELAAFGAWLEDHPYAFTAVLDGPNVAYLNQNFEHGKFRVRQLQAVADHREAAGHVVLVVLPAKYCEAVVPNHSKRRPRAAARDEPGGTPLQELEDSELAAIKAWAERGALYVVPRGCHDDLYWMLATVSRDQPLAVSNDKTRDHWPKLIGEAQYRRWAPRSVVNFGLGYAEPDDAGDEPPPDVRLDLPKAYAARIHEARLPGGRVSFHVPDRDDGGAWLLATLPAAEQEARRPVVWPWDRWYEKPC